MQCVHQLVVLLVRGAPAIAYCDLVNAGQEWCSILEKCWDLSMIALTVFCCSIVGLAKWRGGPQWVQERAAAVEQRVVPCGRCPAAC